MRDLLYSQGFTIAGARKKLQQSGQELSQGPEPALVAARGMRDTLLQLREDVLTSMQRLSELGQDPEQPLRQEVDISDDDHLA